MSERIQPCKLCGCKPKIEPFIHADSIGEDGSTRVKSPRRCRFLIRCNHCLVMTRPTMTSVECGGWKLARTLAARIWNEAANWGVVRQIRAKNGTRDWEYVPSLSEIEGAEHPTDLT